MTWDPRADRSETEAERIDRNWGELLQELRVAQTGVQILAGFLLILPFQPAFERLSTMQQYWYLGTVSVALVATAFLLAPVVAHRLVFRRHTKDRLLRAGDTMAKVGLGMLAVTLISALGLVTGVVIDPRAAAIASGLALISLAVLWVGVPLSLLRHQDEGPYQNRRTEPP